MIKKIIVLLIILVAVLGGFYAIKNNKAVDPALQDNVENIDKITINPEAPNITLPFSNDPKDLAWELFQKYLAYNKTRNLDGVASVVYKVAPVCANPQTRIDCEARMASAYSYGSALKKEAFVNVWTDEKQTILATDFWIEDSKDMNLIGRFRSIIFFVKDESGNLKLVSFSPTKGGATNKGGASEEELIQRVTRWSEDTDEDGIADYDEECLGAKEGEVCEKTNPKLRDTNGNGWWDGIETLI